MDLDSPPNDNELSRKLERENLDRNSYSGPLKNKMRSHVDHRMAMNSGIPESVQSYYINTNNFDDQYYPPVSHEYNYVPKVTKNDYIPSSIDINCIEISHHIKSCPICSKFYENDKSSYVIFIVILIVIIIILFKKVLERQ
jgi:hypothetical protein